MGAGLAGNSRKGAPRKAKAATRSAQPRSADNTPGCTLCPSAVPAHSSRGLRPRTRPTHPSESCQPFKYPRRVRGGDASGRLRGAGRAAVGYERPLAAAPGMSACGSAAAPGFRDVGMLRAAVCLVPLLPGTCCSFSSRKHIPRVDETHKARPAGSFPLSVNSCFFQSPGNA